MERPLKPDPWEYPKELRGKRTNYTRSEFFRAAGRFNRTFNAQIPLGFGVGTTATPVLLHAIETNNPKFYYDWEEQVSKRAAQHGLRL